MKSISSSIMKCTRIQNSINRESTVYYIMTRKSKYGKFRMMWLLVSKRQPKKSRWYRLIIIPCLSLRGLLIGPSKQIISPLKLLHLVLGISQFLKKCLIKCYLRDYLKRESDSMKLEKNFFTLRFICLTKDGSIWDQWTMIGGAGQ